VLVVEDHPGGRAAATSAGGRAGDDPRRAHGRRGAGARGAACRSAAAAGPALVGAAAVVPQARTSPCAAGAETAERLRTPFRQRLDGDGRRAQVLQLLHKVVRALSHSSRPRGPSPTLRVTNSRKRPAMRSAAAGACSAPAASPALLWPVCGCCAGAAVSLPPGRARSRPAVRTAPLPAVVHAVLLDSTAVSSARRALSRARSAACCVTLQHSAVDLTLCGVLRLLRLRERTRV